MAGFGKKFRALYEPCRRDIFKFAERMMRCDGVNNFRITDQQAALFESIQREQRIPEERKLRRWTVKSGKGPGKTASEVIIACWRAMMAVDSMVIVTAPSMRQLTQVWIAEARRMIQKAHPVLKNLTEISNTKIVFGNRPIWCINAVTATKMENFQGYHDKYLTMIFDEASGIGRDIIAAAKDTLTNRDSMLLAAGNPNTRECAFFDMFHKPSESRLWHKFTWNAEDAPHVDKANLKRIEDEFGRNSDRYRVAVLGEFPTQEPNAVMSSDDLWACAGIPVLQAAAMRGDLQADKCIGIDIARFGSDESVIYRRSGLAIVEQCILTKTEPLVVIERAFAMQANAGWSDRDCWYVVDADGMGQGVMGFLRRAGKRLMEFHNNGKSSSSNFSNKITEAYFNVAKLARQRKIHIPNDELLVQQLSSRLFSTDVKGKLLLEKKDIYRKRLEGDSPDRADALVMAYYNSLLARGRVA